MNFVKRRSFGLKKKRRSLNSTQTFRHQAGASVSSAVGSALEPEDSCIKVVVRSRPLNEREAGRGHEVVGIVDEQVLCFDPPQAQEDFFFQGQKQHLRDLNKRVNKNIQFMFDRVFDGTSSNETVFAESVRSIIDNLLSGFNCSVFAYGATGAGKTYTMLGSQTCPGIIYLIVKELFNRMEQIEDKICELNVSYLEVYNETVKDLLRPSPPLLLRDDSKSVMVAGLSYQKPTSAEHLLELLHFGNRNRTQHPTDANAESSRSHAVFQIFLKMKDRVGGLSENVQISKMSLIDLAGSERASVVSNHAKARIREGANINQSLLALGSCINALASKNGKTPHVPYRNSKLTRILKDSLGGNCKTIMIAAISPSSQSYEDTYNTLKYAERAKGIAVSLKRNVASVDAHFTKYKKVVDNLQKENESLKRQVSELNNEASKRPRIETTHASAQTLPHNFFTEQVCPPQEPVFVTQELNSDWKKAVDILCQQVTKLTKDILDCDSNIQSMKATRFWRQFSHNRTSTLTGDHNRVTRSFNKLESYMKSNQMTMERLGEQKDKNLQLLGGKMQTLNHVLASENSEMGRLYIANQKYQLDNLGLNLQLQHAVRVANTNFKQTHESWRLCEQALQQARKQQSMLKGHGFLTSDLVTEFDNLLRQAECGREVAWPDQKPVPNSLHQEFLTHLLLPSANPLAEETSTPLGAGPSRPLAVFHSGPSEAEYSPVEPPSTPKRDGVSSSRLPSPPPFSLFTSPVPSSVGPVRSRLGSPYPTSPYRQMSNEEIQQIGLQNCDPLPVRRSIEEEMVSSTTGGRHQCRVAQKGAPENWQGHSEVQDISCSPGRFQSLLSNLPDNSMSTPFLDRPRSFSNFPPRLEFSDILGSESAMNVTYVPTACVNPRPVGIFEQFQPSVSPFIHPGSATRAFRKSGRHSPYPRTLSTCPATITQPTRQEPQRASVHPSPRSSNVPETGRNRNTPRKQYPGTSNGPLRTGATYRADKLPGKENLDRQKPTPQVAQRKLHTGSLRPVMSNKNQKSNAYLRPLNK